ncbi:MAG: transglycosylase SLT domain-containing protein [Myxococcota bacterium]
MRAPLVWVLALYPSTAGAVPAGSAQLLSLPVERLARAQNDLDRGRPAEALKILGDRRLSGLEDRAQLIRGWSALATGQWSLARTALEAAEGGALVPSVRHQAQVGLIDVFDRLDDDAAKLDVIDRMKTLEPVHQYARAEALMALDRPAEAAATLRRLRLRHPESSLDDDAARLERQLRAAPLTSAQIRTRVNRLLRAGASERAEREAKALNLSGRAMLRFRWRLAQARGDHAAEQMALKALYRDDPNGREGDEVLFGLARAAWSRDDDATAQDRFDELVRRFPRSKRASEARFLAGWIAYDSGDFEEAQARMLTLAKRKHARVTEALWYAGWSAYLAGDDDEALSTFRRLRTDYPNSDLVPFVWYWTGRIHERNQRTQQAKAAFRDASESSPLSYYGFSARARASRLGLELPEPRPKGRIREFGLPQIISSMGPTRPLQVDRAIAFHERGLRDWAQEELRSALSELPPADSVRSHIMRADLCRHVDAPREAYRLALRARSRESELLRGEQWTWRVFQHRYPRAYEEDVRRVSALHQVSPWLVWAIMRTESSYQRDAKSPAGALGLMQLLPRTARAISQRDPRAREHAHRLLEPVSNAWLGSWYLARLEERFPDFVPLQVAAYNAGPTAAQRWLEELNGVSTEEFVERISYRETRRYVRRVLENLWAYQTLYEAPLLELPKTATVAEAVTRTVQF